MAEFRRWFTALNCARKGHDYKPTSVGCGYCEHWVCTWCGNYQGCRRRDGVPPRFQRGGPVDG